ncbi:GSCFA domain-containing protein [Prolixibacteraceae bacterium Z1-6]|uniref:GSCFA domain-containing protein n=1 Tax=Draconibacterium aestuarii TaxID=2998507 RepID=A0A9X3F6H4_9BACT|nr:GSCFA domain-containing protein [Prolixibacteraceae bacterium Z1-6]
MAKSKFQTIVEVPKFLWETGYGKKNLFMGSCFTENVGNKMAALKYVVDINPFGILYNPMSVANALELLLNEKVFSENDLIRHNDLWHSFSHHGRFSANEKNEALQKINDRIHTSSDFLKHTDFLFLTFGTAWIYRYKKSGEVVSNCHKIPAKEFTRERLSVTEIVEKYTGLLHSLWEVNPKLKVIFTVSPIRHWKDGAIENQRSKATLLLAVEELVQLFANDKCAYFPSYEIVMDELRDYRFYAEDMLHLTDVAVNHIWEIFEESLIDRESKRVAKEIKKIVLAINHKPFNKRSAEYLNFLQKTAKMIAELEEKSLHFNLKLEKDYLNVQLKEFRLLD